MDSALKPIDRHGRSALRVLALTGAFAATFAVVGCGTAPVPRAQDGGESARTSTRAHRVPLGDGQADSIAIHALGLVGTPYRYGGNTPSTGFDCSGLIGYVYRSEVGTPPPRTVAQLGAWGEPVVQDELRTGDLVIFGRSRAPHHAGIYVGNGRFVHAPSTGGTVRLDYLSKGYWARQNPEFRRP